VYPSDGNATPPELKSCDCNSKRVEISAGKEQEIHVKVTPPSTPEFFEAKCKLHFKQDAVASVAYLYIAVPFVGVPFSPRASRVVFSASRPADLIGQQRLIDLEGGHAEEELTVGDLPVWLAGQVEVSDGNLRKIKLKVIKSPPQGLSRHTLQIKSKTDPRRVVPLPVLALSLDGPG
jgi:hypothetical protein